MSRCLPACFVRVWRPRRFALGPLLAGALAAPAAAQPTLDELLDLAPPPAAPAEPEGPAASEAPDPSAPSDPSDLADLAGRLDAPADAGDAFRQALSRMDDAAGLLAEAPVGLPAARAQEEVLALLDQVLAAATPPPGGGGGAAGEPGDSPPARNADRPEGSPPAGQAGPAGPPQAAPGPPGSPGQAPGSEGSQGAPSRGAAVEPEPTGGPLEATRRGWGGLPARLRDELTDGLDEPFSPVYREATEDYYRRLSQRATQAAPASTEPSSAPAPAPAQAPAPAPPSP